MRNVERRIWVGREFSVRVQLAVKVSTEHDLTQFKLFVSRERCLEGAYLR